MTGPFHDATAAAGYSPDKLRKTNLFESRRMFCDVYGLLPGQTQAGHVHPDNDKLYSVLTGSCRIDIGEESRVLGPGQIAVAPAGVSHGLRNDSDAPTSLLVVMAPHPKPPA